LRLELGLLSPEAGSTHRLKYLYAHFGIWLDLTGERDVIETQLGYKEGCLSFLSFGPSWNVRNVLVAVGVELLEHTRRGASRNIDSDLIDNLLGSATPAKSGYTFTYAAGTASNGVISQYSITAQPQSSSTGQRYFFTDQSGVIRQTTDGTTPTVTSTPIG